MASNHEIHKNLDPLNINFLLYSTDLKQHHTCTRVIGHHSLSAQTQSSMPLNGLELWLELELKRKPQVSSLTN